MIDQLKVFSGGPYEINSKITMRHPTLADIREYGEQKYFSLVKLICSTPADRKVEIWDSLHIFWEQMDEFDLFVSLFGAVQKEDVSILFDGMDLSTFSARLNPVTREVVLQNKSGVVIDRAIHKILTDYLRMIHGMQKNVDVGYDDYTREIMIDDDRDEQMRWAKKPFESILLPIISSMTNCPEFKYRFDDVWSLPIWVFMDAVKRVQKHKGYSFTMHGVYSGCVDIKKISKKELNWMGELK